MLLFINVTIFAVTCHKVQLACFLQSRKKASDVCFLNSSAEIKVKRDC